MRKPAHQAQFFRLLAEVLGYIVSGDNDVGFVSKSEWNTYWKIETGMNVLTFPPQRISHAHLLQRILFALCRVRIVQW